MTIQGPVPIIALGLLLVTISPGEASACVIVNVNGSIDSDLVRSCVQDGRKLRSFVYTESYSEEKESQDKPKDDVKDYGSMANTSKKPSKPQSTPSEGQCPKVEDSQVRRMLCMFVSGFSLAAGIILVLWIGLGGMKRWQHQNQADGAFRQPGLYNFLQEGGTSSEDSSRERQDSSNRAEAGSSTQQQRHNQPFRSVMREGRADVRPEVRPQAERQGSRSQATRGTASAGRSTSRLNMETAFSSTPAPSEVLLCPEEFWL